MLLLACSSGPDLSPELEKARSSLAEWKAAVELQEQGDAAGALERLGLALQIRPDSPELWLNKAHLLADLGRLDGAVEAATQALRLKPGWPEAYFDRACFESQAGRFREAAADLQVALDAGGSFRLLAAAEGDWIHSANSLTLPSFFQRRRSQPMWRATACPISWDLTGALSFDSSTVLTVPWS